MNPCRALMAYNGDYKPGDPIVIEKETLEDDLPKQGGVEGLHQFVCQNPNCGKTFRRPVLRRKYCSNSCSGKMRWAKERENDNGNEQEAQAAAPNHRRAEADGAAREARGALLPHPR